MFPTLCRRFRTAINVLGDALGAGIVYHLSKSELESLASAQSEEGTAPNGSAAKHNGVENGGFESKDTQL